MKHIRYYIVAMVAILFMVACSSSRKASNSSYKDVPVSTWKVGECVTAKANIRIGTDKGKGVSVGGTLKMKRDDVIILNATYIFGLQIGTMELTRDSVLVVSRYTRQYIRMTYPELSALIGREVTFKDMQDIFWGEAEEFRIKSVEWKYGSFAKMDDDRRLPEQLDLTFEHGVSSLEMSLTLSRHKYEAGWNTRSSFNTANYEQLSPEQIKKLVTMLIGIG